MPAFNGEVKMCLIKLLVEGLQPPQRCPLLSQPRDQLHRLSRIFHGKRRMIGAI